MRVVLLALGLILLALQPAAADGFNQNKKFGGFMKGASAPWLKHAMKDVGTNPTGWSHQWCGKYMNMALAKAGRSGTGSNTAISFARYGKKLNGPKVGAIAVMPHHVGIVTSFDGSSVTLVSGNHGGRSGNRTVGVGKYSRSRIVAYRWPG